MRTAGRMRKMEEGGVESSRRDFAATAVCRCVDTDEHCRCRVLCGEDDWTTGFLGWFVPGIVVALCIRLTMYYVCTV